MDNAGTISTRYSINDYRLRSDGLAGNMHSNSSVVGGGITGTGSGGMASSSSSIISDVPHSPTPPLQRRLAKSFSVAPSSNQNKGALIFALCFYTLASSLYTSILITHTLMHAHKHTHTLFSFKFIVARLKW